MTNKPTRAGQLVVSTVGEQLIGITTDWPRKRTPQIPVQYIGFSYPVLASIDQVRLITIDELAAKLVDQ